MVRVIRFSRHLLLTFHFLLGIGFAQPSPTSRTVPVEISNEIVVTASRHEEKVASVPANVSVLTGKDIANSTAQDIPSLLRTVPGVQVIDIGGNRRNYRVDVRGFEIGRAHV